MIGVGNLSGDSDQSGEELLDTLNQAGKKKEDKLTIADKMGIIKPSTTETSSRRVQ